MFLKVSRLCLHRNGTVFVLKLSMPSSFAVTSSVPVRHAHVKAATLNAYPRGACLSFRKHICQQQGLEYFSTRTRRRRRQGAGIPNKPVEHDPHASADDRSPPYAGLSASLSSEKFLSVSRTLLDRVESAITELKDCNDGLEIARYPPSSPDLPPDEAEIKSSEPPTQQHEGQLSFQVQSSEDFFWGGGTYLLTIQPRNAGGVVTLQSPLSGSFTYVYNSTKGEWVGDEDGHSLFGMLTRDWIRQCRGVPDF
mmetsp:Transcript_18609/g.39954  ORF Transcript_18609/g.39954 Transcript_18609/m.39954 type:complete len:252 (+) Transcript_18609:141-896(+)